RYSAPECCISSNPSSMRPLVNSGHTVGGEVVSERPNYSVFHAGPFHGLAARFGAAGSGGVGELFLADLLGLSGQEVVLVHMPPGGEILVDHTNGGHEELVVCVLAGAATHRKRPGGGPSWGGLPSGSRGRSAVAQPRRRRSQPRAADSGPTAARGKGVIVICRMGERPGRVVV